MTQKFIKSEDGFAYFTDTAKVELDKCVKCGDEIIASHNYYRAVYPRKRESFNRRNFCEECHKKYQKDCVICGEFKKYPESFALDYYGSYGDGESDDRHICQECFANRHEEILARLLSYEYTTYYILPHPTAPPAE